MIDNLRDIAADLRAGKEAKATTTRNFLDWFGVQRRGFHIVAYIRTELAEAGIETVPDFVSAWIDGHLSFRLLPAPLPVTDEPAPEQAEPAALEQTIRWVSRDPTYRMSKLAAANGGVTSVNPDAPLSEAVTLMMSRDFSQLPVMTNERTVKGVISWLSMGSRLSLGKSAHVVREAMNEAKEVSADSSIFDAIPIIVQHGYVLVRDPNNIITGIVTSSDLSLQFQMLTEPFLLLSEIENLIRNMIGEKFTLSQIKEARDPGDSERSVATVADLTFGEYIRLLENPARWPHLGMAIDRKIFCKDLDQVRQIRNDVTHFDPDGITPEDLRKLRDFTNFLKQLEKSQQGY